LTSQSRRIKSDRVGSGSSLRTWASREYFPRAEEELVPSRVVAKGEVKDERHQGADVLYSDRLGMGMGVGVGIEVGQGSSLMEKERITKGRGTVCTDSRWTQHGHHWPGWLRAPKPRARGQWCPSDPWQRWRLRAQQPPGCRHHQCQGSTTCLGSGSDALGCVQLPQLWWLPRTRYRRLQQPWSAHQWQCQGKRRRPVAAQ